MSIVEKLTEGIVRRDLAKEGAALLNKWERTGLLEGLDSDYAKNNMASLLENQAKELLREASLMSAGDVEGFAAVAFPIVRRVFGSLIANDLVSVQPMSLPSGLIFFLDFRFGGDRNNAAADRILDYEADASIYGQGVLGQAITGGVSIDEDKQPYGFQTGYSSPTASIDANDLGGSKIAHVLAGQAGDNGTMDKVLRFDPDIASGTYVTVYSVDTSDSQLAEFDTTEGGLANLVVCSGTTDAGHGLLSHANLSDFGTSDLTQVRRLTQYSGSSRTLALLVFTADSDMSSETTALGTADGQISLVGKIADDFGGTANAGSSNALGAVVGTDNWGLEASNEIPEIEIQVDSVSVTARTKKLKAKWSPELGQDLNAYHNLDAEVELTSILSEQIALEIDREILADLIAGAKAATYYWSRSPGLFVKKDTGAELGAASAAPDFTGTVSEWYETLIETINDVSAQIHRKTLRGGANFLVCSPEVANILEFTSGFRANVSHADDKGTVGAVNVGSISKKFDVMVDPYFPRNVVLVGRKGNSFLESGYVYAPYVPLQVTPTIFGTEDFVPRKGVMTRYAKKMVRPDMYGLVVIRDLLGGEGAS
tara:strand:- start:133 stop:1923 length:1791 start_codon:yes stop_codon:yes gene_type:complete